MAGLRYCSVRRSDDSITPSKASLATVLMVMMTAATPACATDFYSGFPHYTDPVTSNTVYQISSESGKNYVFYYHQYYSSDTENIYYINIAPGDWRKTFYKVNLFTGSKTVLSSLTADNELINGNYFYGSNYGATPGYIGRQDLTTGVWTSLYSIPSGWRGSDNVTVNSNGTYLIFALSQIASPSNTQWYLLNLLTGAIAVLRQEPAADGYIYNHFDFSMTDPNVFRYYVEDSTHFVTQVGFGKVSTGVLQRINLPATSGSYFDPAVWNDSFATMNHPVWNADGRLCTDINWHPQNPVGMYGFACFDLGSDPFAPIGGLSQELRFIPEANWSLHFKDADGAPNWFVGDGNLLGANFDITPNPYVNLLQIMQAESSTARYLTNVYNLAQIRGTGTDQDNAHLVGGNQGVITTWDGYNIIGSSVQSVFLISVPSSLQNLLASARTSFSMGAKVQTTAAFFGWSLPDTNNGIFTCWEPSGTKGVIVEGPVIYDTYLWWKVSFGPSCTAWGIQPWLVFVSS